MSSPTRQSSPTDQAPAPTRLVRVGLALAVAASLLAFAVRARAQDAGTSAVSLRPVIGALVPTGDERAAMRNAVLVGGQATFALHPNVAVVGTLAWSPSQEKLSAHRPTLDLFQYDVGLEGRLNDVTRAAPVATRPFATFGAGYRAYKLRNVPNADAQTNPLLFGAAGVDLEQAGGRFGLRLEARDNVTWFKGLRGDLPELQARNDLQFSAGLTFGV